MQTISDSIDLSDYLRAPEFAAQVKPASTWADEVVAHFESPSEARGARLPWSKAHDRVRLREGEVSLWEGTNYSGKSLITGQVAFGLCRQRLRTCIASLEMRPYKTMHRMVRQAAGSAEPESRYIRDFHAWTDERLWLFDHVGEIEWTKVVALARYCDAELGIRHLVIDSLMKCVRGEDDYNGQKDFVGALCSVALQTGMHIHLVHHTRKPSDDSHQPTRFDAKGSGAIADQVDNVFIAWRNRPKEKAIEKAAFEKRDPDAATLEAPDTLLIVDKQRNGEWDGKLGLYFDDKSQSYRDRIDVQRGGFQIPDHNTPEPGSNG